MKKYLVLHLESIEEFKEAKVELLDITNFTSISEEKMSITFNFSSYEEGDQLEDEIACILMDLELYGFHITMESYPENDAELINIPIINNK